MDACNETKQHISRLEASLPIRKRKNVFRAAATIFVHILILLGGTYTSIQAVQTRRTNRGTDQDALDIWLRHFIEHTPRISDRNGLRQMGFASYIFAELTRQGERARTAYLSEQIFDFFPGARDKLEVLNRTPVPMMGRFEQDTLTPTVKSTGPPAKQRQRTQSKRGIVMLANDSTSSEVNRQITALRSASRMDTPVEVFFYGGHDLCQRNSQLISRLSGVKIIDMLLLDIFDEDKFELEGQTYDNERARLALALLATSFDEVIYLHHGIVPREEASHYFSSQPYQKTGALFLSSTDLSMNDHEVSLANFLQSQLGSVSSRSDLTRRAMQSTNSTLHMSDSLFLLDRRRPGIQASLLLHAWMFSAEGRHTLWRQLGHCEFIFGMVLLYAFSYSVPSKWSSDAREPLDGF